MARRTRVVIETTGGSPIFHIPFPLSSLAALAEVNPHGSDTQSENVELIFRNIGGKPTFHVGGAEVGVAPQEAWDYATVVKAVMQARSNADTGRTEDGQVRVKVEEESPRIPHHAKGKGKERKGRTESRRRVNEQAQASQSQTTNAQSQIPDHNIDVPTTMPPPSQRSISAEEHAALRRGLPLHILDEVYAQGRRDFAAQCAPLQSPDRPLTRDEAAEWHALWEALLHLDRVFSGPLRDNDALKVRRDMMMDEAERRVKAKYREQANKNRSGRPSGVPPAIQARGSGSRGDVSTAGMKANNRGPRDAVADASRHSASDPKFSSNTGLPLERYAPADADPDAVVAHVREALRPLHSAMLARASAGSGGRSMASGMCATASPAVLTDDAVLQVQQTRARAEPQPV
ncbi:hypothetical protein B0H11DRAFT_394981 [Mycena galericulata]|nr:hypothetical protein B0H11DRAFT_394981 [Mycena galericulata]